jgi:predicted nucleic acid-binding protein
MTVVVDASVAVKWYVDEPGARAARDLVASGERLVAPTLVLTEVANALWRKRRLKLVEADQARRAVQTLPRVLHVLEPLEDLNEDAFALADDLDHPVYDCLYVVLAERIGASLATMDRRLIDRLRSTDHWPRVRPLSDS